MPDSKIATAMQEVAEKMQILGERTNELAERQNYQIETLTGLASQMIHQLKWTKRFQASLAFILVVGCVCLSLIFFNVKQIDRIQSRTNNEVFCPAIERALLFYNPDGPAAKADPVEYENNTKSAEKAADIIGCKIRRRKL